MKPAKQTRYAYKYIRVFLVSFLIAHLLAFFPAIGYMINRKTGDLFMQAGYQLKGRQKVSPYFTLLNLDDVLTRGWTTLNQERKDMAEILTNLRQKGARTILVDILYEEREEAASANESLSAAVQNAGNIFFPLFLARSGSGNPVIPEVLEKASAGFQILEGRQPFKLSVGMAPFRELCKACRGLGGITIFPDADGIIRRIPLLYSLGKDTYVPALILNGLCHYLQVPLSGRFVEFGSHILLKDAVLPDGEQKDLRIPIDRQGQLIVNYAGPLNDSLDSYSLANLLPRGENKLDNSLVDDNLILIGDITTKNKDLTLGIFDDTYPVANVLANAINTILTENYLQQPGMLQQILLSLFLIVLLTVLALIFKKKLNTLWIIVIMCIYLLMNLLLFLFAGRLPELSVHLSALLMIILGLFLLEKQEIRKILSETAPLDFLPVLEVPWKTVQERTAYLTNRLLALGLNGNRLKIGLAILNGLQNKEIADIQERGIAAVAKSINQIYTKLNVSNRIEFYNKVYGLDSRAGENHLLSGIHFQI